MHTRHRFQTAARGLAFLAVIGCAVAMADEDSGLKEDLGDEVHASWIYDDVETGYAQAKASGKPLLVVFR